MLSWILKVVAQHGHLSKTIVFKGGTVLKKIYFEDCRFSDDPDFTLLKNQITNEQISTWFKVTVEYVREEANIPLELIDPDSHRDRHGHEDDDINFTLVIITARQK